MSKSQTQSVSARVCDVFEQGCMYCANRPPSVFNPESYPQKMHIAEMTYCSPQGTLYVRETTAEVEKAPGDDYIVPLEKKPTEPEPIDLLEQYSPSYFKGLKQSCSGITFVEEKEERARVASYKATLKTKLEQRELWKAFQEHIKLYRKMKQMKGTGPPWFQELSSNQLLLLDSLPAALKADSDEKTVMHTRRMLNDLGITPSVESKLLEKAIQDCELDPLFFLARIQSEINDLETKKPSPPSKLTNFEGKKRQFTVSERILLSSVVHLHLPILLFKLHLILPGPKEDKSGKLKNVISPLPEPKKLPDPKKEWYKPEMPNQEFETMINELEVIPLQDSKATINKQIEDSPSVWTMASITPIRDRKSQFFNDGKTKDVASVSPDGKKLLPKKSEEYPITADFPSFQSFYQGMEPSDSNYFIMESFTQTNISFHENQPVLRQKVIKESDSITEKIEEEVTDLIPSSCHRPDKWEKPTCHQGAQTEAQWLPPDTPTEVIQLFGSDYTQVVLRKPSGADVEEGLDSQFQEEPDFEDIIANLIASLVRKPTESELMRKEKLQKCLEQNDIDGLYEIFGIAKPERRGSASSGKRKQKRKTHPSQGRESTASDKSAGSDAKSPEEDELEVLITKIRDEVKKQSVTNQLKVALKILAASGDPIANFPDLIKHPVIRRWYEIRRGIKRKLSEREKERLLTKSRRAWQNLISTTEDIIPPSITTLTSDQLAKFTWDKRLWVKKQANLIRNEFNRELRQSLVDDARILYPTMYANYYDSKLNYNFRKVFFTYLPAKENDYFIFKPWKPETKI